MVFVKRAGRAEAWLEKEEYHALNPEDAAFVLDKASRDPQFASRAREELERRVKQEPRCLRAENLLGRLRADGTSTAPSGAPR